MKCVKYLVAIVFVVTTAITSMAVSAQGKVVITALSPVDHQYMEQQRSLLDDLARIKLGGRFTGSKDHDLNLLQRMLDDEVVTSNQVRELQAMGVIMGELLARELSMHWVIYDDKLGRSRALRYRDSDNYLFPMTMISRLRTAGNLKSVADIYRSAYDTLKPLTRQLPFQ